MMESGEMLEFDEAAEPGTTAVLTEEGWQVTDYEAPGEGWTLLADGSWESPDGQTRSFPIDAATGD
jgi:hypothetical protein